MKFLLLLSLMTFSRFSFSAEETNVVNAIFDSLISHDLNCINLTENDSKVFKATKLKVSDLDYKHVQMTIDEKQQPVITFFLVDWDEHEELVTIATNSDLNIVKEIKWTKNSVIKTKSKNLGTITNPRYEDIIVRTEFYNIECK